MVNIVTAEEEETDEENENENENEMLVDLPRPSSPWDYFCYDYEAYYSQNSSLIDVNVRSHDPYYLLSPPPVADAPLWDFQHTHIPPSPYVTKLTSPFSIPIRGVIKKAIIAEMVNRIAQIFGKKASNGFTQDTASLLPNSSASTSQSQISNLNGCNQQSSSRSMSELTEHSQSFLFLGNSQVSFSHETPMHHMPELFQEDSLLCPPQSEQLTIDTVLHINHTFPPETTTRQEEVVSTEKIDNIRKCVSFEHQSAVEPEAEAIYLDEGDFSSASQTVDTNGILLKKNKRKISRSIELEDLQPYYGKTTREEAAKSLGVSVSTVKRICREQGIARWPYRKINKDEYSPCELKDAKTGASIQSSLTMPFQDALPSKPLVQFVQSGAPSFNPPPRQLSTVTAAQTSPPERFVTIKATYDGTDTIIMFDLSSSATMDNLEGEVAKRLKLKVGSFTIKYQDQEGEWISVTCCDDLQYCIRKQRTLATIRMLVKSTTSGPT